MVCYFISRGMEGDKTITIVLEICRMLQCLRERIRYADKIVAFKLTKIKDIQVG